MLEYPAPLLPPPPRLTRIHVPAGCVGRCAKLLAASWLVTVASSGRWWSIPLTRAGLDNLSRNFTAKTTSTFRAHFYNPLRAAVGLAWENEGGSVEGTLGSPIFIPSFSSEVRKSGRKSDFSPSF